MPEEGIETKDELNKEKNELDEEGTTIWFGEELLGLADSGFGEEDGANELDADSREDNGEETAHDGIQGLGAIYEFFVFEEWKDENAKISKGAKPDSGGSKV